MQESASSIGRLLVPISFAGPSLKRLDDIPKPLNRLILQFEVNEVYQLSVVNIMQISKFYAFMSKLSLFADKLFFLFQTTSKRRVLKTNHCSPCRVVLQIATTMIDYDKITKHLNSTTHLLTNKHCIKLNC